MAQGVAQDVEQDVAQGVSGAAEDGGVKVLIFSIVIFESGAEPTPNTSITPPPRCSWAAREGRTRKGRGARRSAQRRTWRRTWRRACWATRRTGGWERKGKGIYLTHRHLPGISAAVCPRHITSVNKPSLLCVSSVSFAPRTRTNTTPYGTEASAAG